MSRRSRAEATHGGPDERNADYYARTRDRIILRESELRVSTILEIIECLESIELHQATLKLERDRAMPESGGLPCLVTALGASAVKTAQRALIKLLETTGGMEATRQRRARPAKIE